MCGFVGYINRKEKDDQVIQKMGDRIKHRGPDSEGVYRDNNLHMTLED